MKRFIKIFQKQKEYVKMTNQTNFGFDLIILDDDILNEFLEIVNKYEENSDEINLVWQFKFKRDNYSVYKDCIFSTPQVNYYGGRTNKKPRPFGKIISVTCKGKSDYSYSSNLDTYTAYNPFADRKSKKYKDGKLLSRMLKIHELNMHEFGDKEDLFFS